MSETDSVGTKKRRRFGLPEIIFTIGIALVVFGGAYLTVTKFIFPAPIVAQTMSGQKISIPAGWELYSNSVYKFSIAHPSSYRAKELTYTLPATAEASDRSVFGVDFEKGSDRAPLGVNVSHQTLDQAITYAKSNIANYPDKKSKLTITKDETLTVAGHKARRIDVHVVDGSGTATDFTNIYVEANASVYNIATEYSQVKPFDDSDAQTMYKSFTIN